MPSVTSTFPQRFTYQIYRRSSALAHFFAHRIKPAGALIFFMTPLLWLLLPLHSITPLLQLRGLLFVILGVSAVWAFLRKAQITATRELPRVATAGETLPYRVSVKNESSRSLSGAILLDMPPDNRPSLELFLQVREPYEESRNIFDRTLAYYRWEWLQKKLTLFHSSPSPPLPKIASGETLHTTLSFTPKRRGVILINDLRICLPDPLGLFQRCRKTISTQDKLIVLPRRYRLPPLNLPGNAQFQIGGETASSAIGQSGDFVSTREYRPGDPLLHIHWKSWARTGKPIIKEYEDVFFPRYGLMLDTFAQSHDADLFEEAVSVAASFCAQLDTQQTLLDLMFIRDEAFHFTAGRGEENIDRMLEVLAGVTCEPTPHFQALQQLVIKHSTELTVCICLFTGWCSQRQETLIRLQRSGIALKVYSICRDITEAKTLHKTHPTPTPIHWLRLGHIEEDLHRIL